MRISCTVRTFSEPYAAELGAPHVRKCIAGYWSADKSLARPEGYRRVSQGIVKRHLESSDRIHSKVSPTAAIAGWYSGLNTPENPVKEAVANH